MKLAEWSLHETNKHAISPLYTAWELDIESCQKSLYQGLSDCIAMSLSSGATPQPTLGVALQWISAESLIPGVWSWDFILVLVTLARSLLWFHLTSRTSLVWPGWNQVWFVFFFLSINFYDSDIHAFCPREKRKIKIWWNRGDPMCALNKKILYLYLKKKISSVIGISVPKSN